MDAMNFIWELSNKRYTILCKVAEISDDEARIFRFDGESFYPQDSGRISILDVEYISLDRIEVKNSQKHVGTTKIDGDPDWRYKDHVWISEQFNLYYVLLHSHNENKMYIETQLSAELFNQILQKFIYLVVALRTKEFKIKYQNIIRSIEQICDLNKKSQLIETKRNKISELVNDIKLLSSPVSGEIHKKLCNAETHLTDLSIELKTLETEIENLKIKIEDESCWLKENFHLVIDKELPSVASEIAKTKMMLIDSLLDASEQDRKNG